MFFRKKKASSFKELEPELKRKKVRAYLIWLLARREYSRHALMTKLKNRDLEHDEADQYLNELEFEKLYNPDAYTSMRVRSLAHEGYSVYGIKNKLSQQKVIVTLDEIRKIFKLEDISEEAVKLEFFSKCSDRYGVKSKSDVNESPKSMQNMIKKIEARGYRSAEVWQFIE